jgi:hypothetical protein
MMPVVTESSRSAAPPAAVLTAFSIEPASPRHVGSGLINQTWAARDRHGTPCVLQRVNPVFPAEIQQDIDVVTRHLRGKGLSTPALIPSRSGSLGTSTTAPFGAR